MKEIRLKDGTRTRDPRLDRLIEFDEASRQFPIRALVARKRPRSMTWKLDIRLDQGKEGACVGFGITHELAAAPSPVPGLTAQYAREKIYWEAQKIDGQPGGAYPGAVPVYEGTSVLAGLKTAQKLGWMDSYRWAFGIDDLILGVGHNGPAVLGIPWYQGMMTPDSKGVIRPTGKLSGGHCILTRGVDVLHERFRLPNSWGRPWGIDGECFISFSDMDRLLHDDGEAAFFVGRHVKPGTKNQEQGTP
jgi:hypothetical protein